jgi:hypothetical protein
MIKIVFSLIFLAAAGVFALVVLSSFWLASFAFVCFFYLVYILYKIYHIMRGD